MCKCFPTDHAYSQANYQDPCIGYQNPCLDISTWWNLVVHVIDQGAVEEPGQGEEVGQKEKDLPEVEW